MKTVDEYNIILIDEGSHLFGNADYTRLNNAKWYQKLWSKISPKYKRSLIDIQPLESNYEGNGTYTVEL